MSLFPPEILSEIERRSLIGIKAGTTRPDFLDIWMVVVDGRVFARSWGLSARSWYTSFLADKNGAIRIGEEAVPVQARAIAPEDPLQARISAAYLAKYDRGENSFYAQGITQPQHVAQTMEFLPQGED